MYLVVGLGNPGSQYEISRHNVGFMVADRIARELGLVFRVAPFRAARALAARGKRGDTEVLLVKPHTYMNLSGHAVTAAMSYYGVDRDSTIVVYDDLDLEVGRLRIRAQGSAGGHNGMRSIIEQLGTEDIVRVKIGIGRPPAWQDPADYVLRRFEPDELQPMSDAVIRAASAVLFIMAQGVEAAQTEYNRIS